MSLIFRRGLAAVVFASASACVTTPVTDRPQLNLVSDAQMNKMGDDAYAEILAKTPKSSNTALSARLEAVFRRIAAASGKTFNWEFALIDDPKTINAFCLPGGKVAVYTGILPVAKTDAGLAAILGHEVAHAVLRHGAERVSQTMAAQAGLAAASLTFNDSKYRDLIAGALGVGVQFGVMLPFSRRHESEADKVGLQYMAQAGYDPNEAVILWQRMAQAGSGKVPEILSTHPDPLRRADDLRNEIPKVTAFYESSQKQPSTNLM